MNSTKDTAAVTDLPTAPQSAETLLEMIRYEKWRRAEAKRTGETVPLRQMPDLPVGLMIGQEPGEHPQVTKASELLRPSVQAAATIQQFSLNTVGDLNINAVVGGLAGNIEKVVKGDLGRVEATLMAQAEALSSIFTSMAARAALNAGEHMQATESYLRLALKAQAQCRATLETLAQIKNPQPTAFIRQQNIAANQQVNNGASSAALPVARAGNSENQSNEISAVTYEQRQRLDFGTQGAASGRDPAMAALDAGDGA
ncbi:MAG: hypothetical protein NVS9B10_15090 [Nevskia sp.]